MPIDNPFVDLHDYDYHPVEEAWPESIASTILGSSDNDELAAAALVGSYLEGAEQPELRLGKLDGFLDVCPPHCFP